MTFSYKSHIYKGTCAFFQSEKTHSRPLSRASVQEKKILSRYPRLDMRRLAAAPQSSNGDEKQRLDGCCPSLLHTVILGGGTVHTSYNIPHWRGIEKGLYLLPR